MADVVSLGGGEWTAEQVRRNDACLVPLDDVMAGAGERLADADEAVVVLRMRDGSLYLAGSHNGTRVGWALVEATQIVARAVRLHVDDE